MINFNGNEKCDTESKSKSKMCSVALMKNHNVVIRHCYPKQLKLRITL